MKWYTRIFIIVGLLIFGSGSLLMLYVKYGLPWKYDEMKREMTVYLEKRFLDEFVLGDVRFDWKDGGNYYTEAKSTTTGINFYVERSNDGSFDDGYGNEHWSSFGKSLIKPYIPSASTVLSNVTFHEPLPKDKDVLDHLQHTCWTVYIDTHVSPQTNTENELQKLLEAIQKMDKDGICFEYMLIGYMGEYVELHKEDLMHIHEAEKLQFVEYDVWAYNH